MIFKYTIEKINKFFYNNDNNKFVLVQWFLIEIIWKNMKNNYNAISGQSYVNNAYIYIYNHKIMK